MERKIVLVDSGERRYPRGGEYYMLVTPSHYDPPNAAFIADLDASDEEWFCKPEEFIILRVERNDFNSEPRRG